MSENNHGRPQDPPITPDYAAHLRFLADGASDGVWVNPEVLARLLDVFDAACAWRDDGVTYNRCSDETATALLRTVDIARGDR